MNSIINFVIKNKFAVFLMALLVIGFGLFSALNMKSEIMPNATLPQVTVVTNFSNATPQEIAEKITIPIEKAVQNIYGVTDISSSSFSGSSLVQILFASDYDLEKAQLEVNDAIYKVELPNEAEIPKTLPSNFLQVPILGYGIEVNEQNFHEISSKLEKIVVPALAKVSGVQSVEMFGTQKNEIQIIFNEKNLTSYGLTVEEITQSIKEQTSKSSEIIQLENAGKSVIVDEKIASLNDLKEMFISAVSPEGIRQFRLDELAKIEKIKVQEGIVRTNGKEGIALYIILDKEKNTNALLKKVTAKIDKLHKQNKDLKFTKIIDQATPAQKLVSTMLLKLAMGVLSGALIIFLFLRNLRSTIIFLVSIPIPIFTSIFLLEKLNFSLNIVTLGALILASTGIITNSIIVIENIFHKMFSKNEKLRGTKLISVATKEMLKTIVSSTLVTLFVFFPFGLAKGQIGKLFAPFALALAFAMLTSLLISITIVPMLMHLFFKKRLSDKKPMTSKKPSILVRIYVRILSWSLAHKITTITLTLIMFIISITLPVSGKIGMAFYSDNDAREIYINCTAHAGKTLADLDKEAARVEEMFLLNPDVASVFVSYGKNNRFTLGDNKNVAMVVNFKEGTKNFLAQKEKLLNQLAHEKTVGVWQENELMQKNSNKIEYFVYGNTIEELQNSTSQIEEIFTKHGLVNINTSLNDDYEEYTLFVDQIKARNFGLTAEQINDAILTAKNSNNREIITSLKDGTNELNVYTKEQNTAFNDLNDIKNIEIKTPLGLFIKIGDLVTINTSKTAGTINRRNNQICGIISAKTNAKNIFLVSNNVQNDINNLNITTEKSGVALEMKETIPTFLLALAATLFIIYLILVITFGGASRPLAILFVIPLTAIGAFLGLWILGCVIDITVVLGLLILIGIVLTHAIILIDRIIFNEKSGLSTKAALIEAGKTRLRPILLTSFATIFLLVPFIWDFPNSEFIPQALVITIIGGLTSSTLLTLVIVPIIYELLPKFTNSNNG